MKPSIESLQNPKIKSTVKLRESRHRRKTGLILIDGVREIGVALAAGVTFETIFCTHESVAESWPVNLLQPVTPAVLDKLSYGERSSGAVGVAQLPDCSLLRFSKALASDPEPLILVLDRVEKPGNIGAVVRTVATSGAQGLVLIEPQCEVFNPNAIRASLATIFTLPVAVASLSQFKDWLGDRGMRLVRAQVDGQQNMWDVSLVGPLAIALGSEAWGLGAEWQCSDWPAVQIPMRPGADSLNLSVSAAVLCYESLRQRADNHPPEA